MLDRGPSTRADFDALLRTLLGRRIVSVEYCELDYEDGSPAWRHAGAHVDSLDPGLTWMLDDGAPFSFTWGAELAQYGVSIRRAPLRFRSAVRRWNVTERWARGSTAPSRGSPPRGCRGSSTSPA